MSEDIKAGCYIRAGFPADIRTYQEWKDAGVHFGPHFIRVPCVLKKDPSELTEEEKTDYSIWQSFLVPIEPLSLDKLLLLFVLAKYVKDEAGRKHLAEIAKSYLDVVGKTMSALSNAGGSHPLASLIHGRITVTVYETLGLIQPQMARVLYSNMTKEIDVIIAKDYLSEVIGAIVPG